MMIDPSDYARKFDFRAFGDQFFVRANDSLEVKNQIQNEKYITDIQRLKKYYDEFSSKISAKGKEEVIANFKNKR
jgi:hypothetical protein